MEKYTTKRVSQELWDSYILEVSQADPCRLFLNFSRDMSPDSYSRSIYEIQELISILTEEFGEIDSYSLSTIPPYVIFREPIELDSSKKPWQISKRGLLTLDLLVDANGRIQTLNQGLQISKWDKTLSKRYALARFVFTGSEWSLQFISDRYRYLDEAQWRWFGQLVAEALPLIDKRRPPSKNK